MFMKKQTTIFSCLFKFVATTGLEPSFLLRVLELCSTLTPCSYNQYFQYYPLFQFNIIVCIHILNLHILYKFYIEG